MRKIANILFGVALLCPVTLPAQDQDPDRRDQKSQARRYYDRQNKDWHEWNDNENHAYQRYQQENHREDRNFGRLQKKDQENYFQWRHQHPDNDRSETQRER